MTSNARIDNPGNVRSAQPAKVPAPPESLRTTRFAAKNKVAAFLLIVALGFLLRVRGLDAVGFSEDEVNKVEAARGYLRGNFGVNLEHPMLMKWLVTLSLLGADSWNRGLGRKHPVSEETAVRLPNLIFGSLTAIVIFVFAQELFGSSVGLISALLWAIGIGAITVNRLAKEDTLLVFFTWLAYYFYLRAKSLGPSGSPGQGTLYALSGTSFGLMLAAKYFPHYLGLNFLYYHLLSRSDKKPRLSKRDHAIIFGACALAFLVVNPVIVFPSTLRYMLAYVREGTMTHHGYLMMGHFYYDDPAHPLRGLPIYFYFLLLGIKTPLPILGALGVGLVEVFKQKRKPEPFFLSLMFLMWIVPFSLLGAKWLRYMLSLMPVVYMLSAIGIVKIFAWVSNFMREGFGRKLRPALVGAFALVFFLEPLGVTLKAAPFYSLYLNPLGRSRVAYYFPHDELYDAGLREAIREICEQAPPNAAVGGEAPAVFRYYFHKFGRDDLRYFRLSDPLRSTKAADSAYVVVQDGRKYFENISLIQELEFQSKPMQVIRVAGAPAAKLYHTDQLAQLRGPA